MPEVQEVAGNNVTAKPQPEYKTPEQTWRILNQEFPWFTLQMARRAARTLTLFRQPVTVSDDRSKNLFGNLDIAEIQKILKSVRGEYIDTIDDDPRWPEHTLISRRRLMQPPWSLCTSDGMFTHWKRRGCAALKGKNLITVPVKVWRKGTGAGYLDYIPEDQANEIAEFQRRGRTNADDKNLRTLEQAQQMGFTKPWLQTHFKSNFKSEGRKTGIKELACLGNRFGRAVALRICAPRPNGRVRYQAHIQVLFDGNDLDTIIATLRPTTVTEGIERPLRPTVGEILEEYPDVTQQQIEREMKRGKKWTDQGLHPKKEQFLPHWEKPTPAPRSKPTIHAPQKRPLEFLYTFDRDELKKTLVLQLRVDVLARAASRLSGFEARSKLRLLIPGDQNQAIGIKRQL
jgi:hypothetical protein